MRFLCVRMIVLKLLSFFKLKCYVLDGGELFLVSDTLWNRQYWLLGYYARKLWSTPQEFIINSLKYVCMTVLRMCYFTHSYDKSMKKIKGSFFLWIVVWGCSPSWQEAMMVKASLAAVTRTWGSSACCLCTQETEWARWWVSVNFLLFFSLAFIMGPQFMGWWCSQLGWGFLSHLNL